MTAAEQATHMVIRASAGTGKTFALSNRYLKLLRQGAPPDTILATTFTRKAAGEILGRVLTRAARAALDARGAAEMAAALGDPSLTLADTRDMLGTLCRSLHRVWVSTIDSFFNRLVQSFRHELGIPPGSRVVAANDPLIVQLRREAIGAMLADESPGVLIDLLRRLHHDTAQRSVTEAIDRIVADLYDVYRQSPPEAWSTIEPPPVLPPDQLADAINGLVELAANNASKVMARGMNPNLRAAMAHDWDGFFKSGLATYIESGQPTYSRAEIPNKIIEVYRPLIAHAGASLLRRVVLQTRATFELLERFDRHYRQLRHDHRVLLFSDLPHKLAHEMPALGDALLTEMYFRLDTRVSHLLLDEFQDTSVEQWAVLRPFAQEVASHRDGSRSFFCVGDTKQAIYGWRGGRPEIFDRLETDLNLPHGHAQKLNKSYRSSPAILDAVNQLFNSLVQNPALGNAPPEVVAEWAGRFDAHSTTHAKRPGYVELTTSPVDPDAPIRPRDESDGGEGDAESEASGGDPMLHQRYAAGRIAELARAMPGREIGVLVATNDMVRRIIHLLRDEGIEASGEGGNPVADDPAVGVILSALTLADHPGDTAAAFHVFHSPLASIVGMETLDAAATHRVGLSIRRSLLAEGYAALIANWSRKLAGSCGARGAARLMQLIELADAFDPAMTLRASDFVAFVEATPVEQPARAPVRVMTVHKAKGLEFDVVVLPQLERLLLSKNDLSVYTDRANPEGTIQAVHRAGSEAVRHFCPPMAAAYEQARATRFRDDLCTLYVAMTRARYALHMIVPPLTQRSKGEPGTGGWSNLSYASMLRRGLSSGPPTYGGEETLFQCGDPAWFKSIPAPHPTGVSRAPATAPRPRLASAPTVSRRTWRIIAPSSRSAGGRVRASDLLAVTVSESLARGTAMHAWYEKIGFMDRVPLPDDESLLAAAALATPLADPAKLRGWLGDFRKMLALPAVRAALAAPAGDGWELWRERAFVARVGGELIRGRFDRVAVRRSKGRPINAALLDFKTDVVGAGALPQRVEAYRPQLDIYRRALAEMLGIGEDAVRASLLFVASGECVEIGMIRP